MEMKATTMTVLFFFLAIWFAGTVESAPAPAPAVDCLSLILLNLVNCVSYVTDNSTVKTPEESCCSGLKMVLKTDAECLCEEFKNSSQLPIPLNLTKALTLPSACHVFAPSVSNCALSPAPAPVGTVGNTPTTIPESLGSAALSASIGSLVLVLIVASFTLV